MAASAGWHRALDVQMDTHKWAISETGMMYNAVFFSTVVEKVMGIFDPSSTKIAPHIQVLAAQLTASYAEAVWRADTMFVTSDMLHLLMQAAQDLPEDATLDEKILLTDRGFCLFEEPIIGTDLRGKSTCINGIVWQKEILRERSEDGTSVTEPELGIVIFFLVDPYDPCDEYNEGFPEHLKEKYDASVPPLTLQHFYPLRFGQTIPEWQSKGSEMIRNVLKLFLAMQLIAQQKIGKPMEMRPDRAARKRYAREYPGRPEKLITLITLRRKSVKKDDHEPQKVEWSRRWIVKGHWHKYWYPKRGVHDYVYIHDYVKGPEDKPLIPTERRIFNFRR